MNFWAWMYISSVITYIVFAIFYHREPFIFIIGVLICLLLVEKNFLLGTILLISLGCIMVLNLLLKKKGRKK